MKKFIKNILPFYNQSIKILKLYNKSHQYYLKGNTLFAKYYSYKIYKKYHCIISPAAELSNSIYFPHPLGVVIGDFVKIGNNCVIYQNVTIGRIRKENSDDYPTIMDNVIIYSNSIISGKVVVSSNCTIGCNSFVNKDTKKGLTYVGSPARVVER